MFERLFEVPRSQRLLLFGGILALILLLYTFFFHLPRAREIAGKEERISLLREERGKLSVRTEDLEKKRAEVAEVNARFQQVMAELPERKEIPGLLSAVSSLGRETGLEILVFRQKPEVYRDVYAEIPVEVAVRGGYHQVAVFFDKVRGLNRIVNVSGISLKNPQPDDGRMVLEASFVATTFRFLTQEERERLAKEKEEAQKGKGKRAK